MAGLGRRTHYRKHLTDSVLYDLPEPKEDERIAKVVATRGGNQFDIILAPKPTETTESSGNKRSGLALLPTKFHKLVWVKRNDYVIVRTGIDRNSGDRDDENTNEVGDEDENDDDDEEAPTLVNADAIETGTSNNNNNGNGNETGIRFIISHILYKEQVKHLVSKGFWPKNDRDFSEHGNSTIEQPQQNGTADPAKKDGGDGIVYASNNNNSNTERDDYYDDGIVYTEYDMDNDDDLFVNTNRIARLEIQDSDSEEEESSDEED